MGAQSTLGTERAELPVELIDMIFKEIYYRPLAGGKAIRANNDLSATTNKGEEAIDDLEATTWKNDDMLSAWSTVKRDLASCALVSRQFHAIATPLLFRDLHLPFSPVSTPRNITSVINFLKTHELVRMNLRSLALTGHPEMERTDAQELLRLLHMLPRLASLLLNNISIVFSEAPPLTVCPALDCLHIRFSYNYSQRDFFRLMHCFGKIGDLRITFWGDVKPSYNDEAIPCYNDVALQIRPGRVTFKFKTTPDVPTDLRDNLLKNPEVASAVTRLQLDHWDSVFSHPGAFEEAQILLEYFKTVTHLEIGILDEDYVVSGEDLITSMHINLSSFSVLTDLRINHSLAFYDSTTCSALLTGLAQCIEYGITPSPVLRGLNLCLKPIRDLESEPDSGEITLEEAMERACEALEGNALAEVLDRFAVANRCIIAVYMMLPSMATTAQETVAVSLLCAIFSKRSEESMEYIFLGVMKGDEEFLIDEPETGER